MSSFQIIPQLYILQQAEKPIFAQNTSFVLCPKYFFLWEHNFHLFTLFFLNWLIIDSLGEGERGVSQNFVSWLYIQVSIGVFKVQLHCYQNKKTFSVVVLGNKYIWTFQQFLFACMSTILWHLLLATWYLLSFLCVQLSLCLNVKPFDVRIMLNVLYVSR